MTGCIKRCCIRIYIEIYFLLLLIIKLSKFMPPRIWICKIYKKFSVMCELHFNQYSGKQGKVLEL